MEGNTSLKMGSLPSFTYLVERVIVHDLAYRAIFSDLV